MTSGCSCLEPSEAVRRNRAEDFGLDLSGFSPQALDDLTARFAKGTMGAFTDTLAKVGYCSRPVRLVGSSATADKATGEVLGTYSSRDAPLGVTYVACGNRRASVCAACSRLYAADTFQMLRAGVAGGKQVPEHVRDNPLLFVTLTAPSFGAVHRASSGQAGCRPETGRPRCRHGASQSCRRHDDEGVVGSPLCPGCYDYTTHVVWQWHAPELWRRFVIRLRRRVAHLLGVRESKLGSVATVQYAKVAEYQVRGAVHFHALIRLDGPRTAEGFAPAPADLDRSALAAEVRCAARDVSYLSRRRRATTTPAGSCDSGVSSMSESCAHPDATTTPTRPSAPSRSPATSPSTRPREPATPSSPGLATTTTGSSPWRDGSAPPRAAVPTPDVRPGRSSPTTRATRTSASPTGATPWRFAGTSPPSHVATP